MTDYGYDYDKDKKVKGIEGLGAFSQNDRQGLGAFSQTRGMSFCVEWSEAERKRRIYWCLFLF
jgi:hypothetical protein